MENEDLITALHNLQQEIRRMRPVSLYQIRDNVAQTVVGPIITVHHAAAAVRHFTDLLQDKNTTLAAHPDDFDLVYLGLQDEESGTIDPLPKPEPALTGKAWRAMQNNQTDDNASA